MPSIRTGPYVLHIPDAVESTMSRHRFDLVSLAAMVAAAITLFVMVAYLGLMRQEADSPAAWF
jgi:hypothetical protein